jgi:hypothetical protein
VYVTYRATNVQTFVPSPGATVGGSFGIQGNLTFTGTGNRITGDFSNATIANRVMFQTSTVNGTTSIATLPNGTNATSSVLAFGGSDPANAPFTGFNNTATESQILASKIGTGTYLPMTFYIGGSERMRVDTSGNVGIGTASPAVNLNVAKASDGIAARFQRSSGGGLVDIETYNGIGGIGTSDNIPFRLNTNNTERMRIDTSGNVGIGTSSPVGRLHARFDAGAGDGYTGKFVFSTTDQALFVKTYWQSGTGQHTTLEASNLANSSLTDLRLNGSTLQFLTGATERARIDSSGNVGIGTSSPISVAKTSIKQAAGGGTGSTQLHLEQSNATDGYGLKCDSADGALAFSRYSSGSYTERARIASNGDFTIASTTLYITNIPTTATAGNCLISAGEGNKFYRSTSSLKYKRNVVDMQRGIADVQQLRPVNFNGVSDFDGDKLFAGFIAEEVEALNFKEFVIYDENGEPDGLQYANMVALLTKAIQEQQQMIETLQAEVAALKGAA